MEHIDKIQIAEEMMTAAIVEYREFHRYFAAINLAGVAEELYGKLLRVSGGKTMKDEVIDATLDASNAENDGFLNRKDIKHTANYYKYTIKHMDSENDRFIRLDSENEARFAIAEAMENRDKLSLPPNNFLDRFSEDAQKHQKNKQDTHHKTAK